MICSDGLSEMVLFDAIESHLAEELISTSAERLLRAALDAGASDNVSLIILEWSNDG